MGSFRFEEMVGPCIRDSMRCYIETSQLALYAPANDGARNPRSPALPHGLAHVWVGKAEASIFCFFKLFSIVRLIRDFNIVTACEMFVNSKIVDDLRKMFIK